MVGVRWSVPVDTYGARCATLQLPGLPPRKGCSGHAGYELREGKQGRLTRH